jgi:hypothetical protein
MTGAEEWVRITIVNLIIMVKFLYSSNSNQVIITAVAGQKTTGRQIAMHLFWGGSSSGHYARN